MAHFALLWKARTIEKYRSNYEAEKINSIMISETPIPKQSFCQRWRHYRYDTQKRISRTFRKWYPEGSSLSNFCLYLRTDQTFPNFVLKSLLGFFGGIVLTYLCFMFFVFQLSISLMHATIMSSIIGVLLTLGLAFSYRIRCLVFLLIPQFFSRVGRYTLTCYALVLILTGPATNTLKNSEVLSESLACGQEQIKTSVAHVKTLMERPLNSLKDSIKVMIEKLSDIAIKMKKIFMKLNRLILSLSQTINTGYLWLNSLETICNEKIGTPYRRCIHSFQDGTNACKHTFGSNKTALCDSGKAMKNICSKYKHKIICVFLEHANGNIIHIVRKRLKTFTERMKHMLYMQVHVHHSYSFNSNTTRTACQVAAGIVTEIRKRADPLLTWLSWSSYVTSLFLLLIIFRAKSYQHMFETRSRFDNRYITKDIRILDLMRIRERKETILPLNRREQAKYVTTTSFRLVASEKAYLTRSVVFMTITTFKLLIHMIADYSLYWVLMTVRHHGRFQTPMQPGDPDIGIHISGSGFTSKLLKSIVDGLSVLLESPLTSPVSCLPNPSPPDLKRYTQIGVLILLLWFFAMFEPYGLRLRHVVMGHYQPDRAKTRAMWLYNHILRARAGFMKLARRKLHRTYKYRSEEKHTIRQWLQHHIPFCWLRSLLGINPEEPFCLLCGTVYYRTRPDTKLIKCNSANCPGIYCDSCFGDIGELCTICLSPEDYGDLSDVSLEKGSSDDSEESDNESDSNKTNEICNLDTCETGATASKKSSKLYRRNTFSGNQTDSEVLISLITNKNDNFSRSKNYTENNSQSQNKITQKVFIRYGKKSSKNTCNYFSFQKKIHIFWKYYNSPICPNEFNKKYLIKGKLKIYSMVAAMADKSCKNSILKYKSITKKTTDKRCHRFIKKGTLNDFRTKEKIFRAEYPTNIFVIKVLKSIMRLTKASKSLSKCSFYQITLTSNSVNVKKIIKNSKWLTAIKKYFINNIKCKMKRKNMISGNDELNSKEITAKYFTNFPKCILKYSCYCINNNEVISNSNNNQNNHSETDNKRNFHRKVTESHFDFWYRRQKLRSLITYYLRYLITNRSSVSHTMSSNTTQTFVSKERKNHKRRKKKKSKSSIETCFASNEVQLRSDDIRNEETRKYRISAFLSDLDWKRVWKKRINNDTKVKIYSNEPCNNISEPLAEIKVALPINKIKKEQTYNNKVLLDVANMVREEFNSKLLDQGVAINKPDFTVEDIFEKYGCDLVTVTSSNTNTEKILNIVRRIFERDTYGDAHVPESPFINKYKELYKPVANIETSCTEGCVAENFKNNEILPDSKTAHLTQSLLKWKPSRCRYDTKNLDESPSPCDSIGDTWDPYIVFSDNTTDARNLCIQKKLAHIKSPVEVFERLKHSLTSLKKLCSTMFTNRSRREARIKREMCDSCCNPKTSTSKEKSKPMENNSADTSDHENKSIQTEVQKVPETTVSTHTSIQEEIDKSEPSIGDTCRCCNADSLSLSSESLDCCCEDRDDETQLKKSKSESTVTAEKRSEMVDKISKGTVAAEKRSETVDKHSKGTATMEKHSDKLFKTTGTASSQRSFLKITIRPKKTATVGTEDLTPKKPDFCDACCGPKVKNWTDKPNNCDACCNTSGALVKVTDETTQSMMVETDAQTPSNNKIAKKLENTKAINTVRVREEAIQAGDDAVKNKCSKEEKGQNNCIICTCAKHCPNYRKFRGEIFKHSPCNIRSETTLSSISRSHATTCTNAATYNLASLERRLKHKQYYKKRTDSKAIQTFDTPRSCDVSTNTKDWWSPIPEKREYRNIGRKTEIDMKEEIKKVIRMRRKMDKAIESNGKVVTFKSRTSIIPSEDIMSPYRYLLESQKYYNELYTSPNDRLRKSPFQHRYIIGHSQRSQSSPRNRQYNRRKRKTKRLDESYSPRKQKQSVYEWVSGEDWTNSRKKFHRGNLNTNSLKKPITHKRTNYKIETVS